MQDGNAEVEYTSPSPDTGAPSYAFLLHLYLEYSDTYGWNGAATVCGAAFLPLSFEGSERSAEADLLATVPKTLKLTFQPGAGNQSVWFGADAAPAFYGYLESDDGLPQPAPSF